MSESSISSDLIRGHIDTIILYSLTDGDKFAQQISDDIEQKSNKEYKINQATLYSSLKRLESLKYVSAYWNDIENGRRKYFHLTDNGKNVINQNLESWKYSKKIINMLLVKDDEETFKETKVNSVIDNKNDLPICVNSTQLQDKSSDKDCFLRDEDCKIDNKTDVNEKSDLDINFRAILSALINNPLKKNEKSATLNSSTIVDDNKSEDVTKFNEIIKDNQDIKSFSKSDTIDFSDLKIKAAEEGYKIKISSKDSAYPNGAIKINKVNFISSLIIFLLSLFEFSAILLTKTDALIFNAFYISTFGIIVILPFLISLFSFIRLPNKTTSKKIHADSILSCFIVAFNIILIIFAIAFLSEIQLSNQDSLFKFIIIPSLFMLNSILYFTIRYMLSKSNKFIIRIK